MDKIEKQIIDAMKKAGKPVKPGEIAEMTKLDKDEVTRIIKKLKNTGAVTSPKNCYYVAK